MQNMKPVKFCTVFIFCIFRAIMKIQVAHAFSTREICSQLMDFTHDKSTVMKHIITMYNG